MHTPYRQRAVTSSFDRVRLCTAWATITWKGVGSFLSVKINVGKNLKDYVNLLLGGCFTFEHVLLSTSVLDYAKMRPWKVGGLSAHIGVFLVSFNSYASSVATFWKGKTLKDFWRTVSTKYHLGFLLVIWACKADKTKITGKQLSWHYSHSGMHLCWH